MSTDRPGDVLETLLANIVKFDVDLAAHLAERVFRDADAAGLGNALEPGCDIDAVTENVVGLDQHVAEMHANAHIHSAIVGDPGIAIRHQLLQRNRTLHRTDDRAEFDQCAVAGSLDDAPAMLGDQRGGGSAMFAQCLCRAGLICPHQPAVADDIGGEDCRETAGRRHSRPASRNPSIQRRRSSSRR